MTGDSKWSSYTRVLDVVGVIMALAALAIIGRDDKGPSASLAPSAAGSTYRKYASPAAFGRRLAAGPFSSL